MTVEAELRTFLAADGTISALVGTRIYATDLKPQNGTMPAIVFQRQGTEWQNHMDGGQSTYIGADFDIDAWGEEYDDANTLREAIISRVQNYRGAMGATAVDRIFITSGPIDAYEQDVEQFRSSIGVTIWYNG